ncbi:MAG: TolB family protein [Solirubrobacteraceae bacterium]
MLRPAPPRERIARSDRHTRPALAALALVALVAGAAGPADAGPSPQRTVRIRVASKGQPNGASANAQISGDGQYVAFETAATNLGPADPNGHVRDVYLYDGKSGAIRLLSAPDGGAGADGASSAPTISADGGAVAFTSLATNLVPRASNVTPDVAPHRDVFAWSRSGGLQQVSVSAAQVPADGDSAEPGISADGQRVVFSSTAGNLVDGHPDGQRDVYLRDLGTAQTVLISATQDGQPGDGESSAPAISPDGRYVSFATKATNLVPGTTLHGWNVVLRDLTTGATELVSVSSSGAAQRGGPPPATPPLSDLSDGARYVVFESGATNLVHGDTNHRTDIFRRDRLLKRTVRASLATTDQQPDGGSSAPSLSADGRYLTFLSRAPNLTPGQPRGTDVFIRDLVAHTTVLAEVSSSGRARSGEQAGNVAQRPSSADDGSTTVFVSSARNLVTGKTSRLPDVFLRRLFPAPITVASRSAALSRGHVVVTFVSVDRQAGPLLCRLDHQARAICPLGSVVLPLLKPGKHLLIAFAGGPGSAYAARPTRVRIVVKRGGRARVHVTNPGAAIGFG